jgi:ketosteroid isomerase-like protein
VDFNTNKEMADRAYNLFEAGELENMAAMWSEDMFWSPANTNDSLSKDQWKQAMKGWHAEFDNFKFSDRQSPPRRQNRSGGHL